MLVLPRIPQRADGVKREDEQQCAQDSLEGRKATFSGVTQDFSGVTKEILDEDTGFFLELRKNPLFFRS